MGLIVQKFGGTSVATAEKIHAAARKAIAARQAGHQVAVVVVQAVQALMVQHHLLRVEMVVLAHQSVLLLLHLRNITRVVVVVAWPIVQEE